MVLEPMHCCIPRRIFRTKGAVAARDLRPAHLPNPRPSADAPPGGLRIETLYSSGYSYPRLYYRTLTFARNCRRGCPAGVPCVLHTTDNRRLTSFRAAGSLCVHFTHGGAIATNLAIDDKLLEEARRVGNLRTKKETVNKALEEFIERRRQRRILKAFGTFRFREGWDYKQDQLGREPGR